MYVTTSVTCIEQRGALQGDGVEGGGRDGVEGREREREGGREGGREVKRINSAWLKVYLTSKRH